MKVSVVIPMYNSEATIRRAISSVVNQTYSGFVEILVIDDGSTDGASEIVLETVAGLKYNRSIELIRKENGGASSARNVGLKRADGEYIAFLDSDDAWHPQKLDLQISFMKESGVKFSGTSSLVLGNDETGPHDRNKYFEVSCRRISFRRMLFISPFSTPSVVIHHSLKHELFDESMRFAEDYNLWKRLACSHKVVKIREPLVYTFKHDYLSSGGSLSSNLKAMQLGVERSYKKMLCSNGIGCLDKAFVFMALYFSKMKYVRRLCKSLKARCR